MTHNRIKVLAAVLLAFLAAAGGADPPAKKPATAAATAPSVDEIVRRTNLTAYYAGADGRAQVVMTITDAQSKTRRRELTILRWDQPAPAKGATQPKDVPLAEKKKQTHCGEQKFYVYFKSPPDVAKMAFLVWKHLDKDDDRWLYQPALDNVKRIAASDKRTSFVGSHFFYEDVSGRNINDDKHELAKTTKDYYVLKNTPKDPKTVEFAHYEMYILRSNFLPVYIYYYDQAGKKYRTYAVEKWDADKADGYPTVVRARMTDTKIGGHTTLEYADVKYNLDLPENLFSERFLKRTPYKYLK